MGLLASRIQSNCQGTGILIFASDVQKWEEKILAWREQGFQIYIRSSRQYESYVDLDLTLRQVVLVCFDLQETNWNAWQKLLHVSLFRERHPGEFSLVCLSVPPVGNLTEFLRNIATIECLTDGIRSEYVQRHLDQLLNESAAKWQRGWGIEIGHRFWMPGTTCQPGEEVWRVTAFNGPRESILPLTTSELVVFDYWAHFKVPQTSAQWAGGLNASPFARKHGLRAGIRAKRSCHSSRIGMRQHQSRIGPVLVSGLQEVGVEIELPGIIERVQRGREIRYRLNPRLSVRWRHVI